VLSFVTRVFGLLLSAIALQPVVNGIRSITRTRTPVGAAV